MKSVKVDLNELQTSYNEIDKLIDSFEEVELSLSSKVLALKGIWNEGNTTSFYEIMEDEKKSFDVLVQDLRNFNNIYNYVHKRMSKYGNEIVVDFNQLSNISNRHNSCNQKFGVISDMYDNLDLAKCPEVASQIHRQESKFRSTQRQLDRYIDKLNDAIDDISEMEYELDSRISNIDIYTINDIPFGELPVFDPDTTLVGMSSDEDIETALNNIDIDIQEESDIISNINSEFVNIRNHYISDKNSKHLSNKQSDFNCEFKVLKHNHENMVVYINNLKEEYLDLVLKTADRVDKDIKKVN